LVAKQDIEYLPIDWLRWGLLLELVGVVCCGANMSQKEKIHGSK
jgi:hypothetical protein